MKSDLELLRSIQQKESAIKRWLIVAVAFAIAYLAIRSLS
jgi:hypothetical protein